MKQEFVPYFEIATSIQHPYQVRKAIVAMAVGYACACNVDLPSSKMENPVEHFVANFSSAIRGWVGYFNEVTVMDCEAACEAAKNFWLMRYAAVHDCPSLELVPGDFFQSLFGASRYFGQNDIEVLNKHNADIAPLYRAACLVLTNWSGK